MVSRAFLVLMMGLGLLTPLAAFADRRVGRVADWSELEQELLKQGVQANVESVIKAARANPDASIRWAAIELLGRRKDASAKGVLRWILANDRDRLLQETAAIALARLGEPGAVEKVKAFMRSAPDLSRQLYLATQLIDFGDSTGYEMIVAAVQSEDEHLRFLSAGSLVRAATAGLTGTAGPQAHELLHQLLRDASSKVRKESVLQLSLGSGRGLSLKEYIPEIEKMAKEDSDPGVREEAGLTLAYWREFKSTGQ